MPTPAAQSLGTLPFEMLRDGPTNLAGEAAVVRQRHLPQLVANGLRDMGVDECPVCGDANFFHKGILSDWAGWICSARLGLDRHGRVVAIVTVADASTWRGQVFVVIGQDMIFTPRGRAPTARERALAKEPYQSTPRWDRPVEIPDDVLDERAALLAARREQQREPVDLFSAAA